MFKEYSNISFVADLHQQDKLMEAVYNKIIGAWTTSKNDKYQNYIKYLISSFIPVDFSQFLDENKVNGIEQSLRCCLLNTEIHSMAKINDLQKIYPNKNFQLAYCSDRTDKKISKRGLYLLKYFVGVALECDDEPLRTDIQYTITKIRLKEMSKGLMPDTALNKIAKKIIYRTDSNEKTQEYLYQLTDIVINN
jgi:ubiquitin C-terminal hydrolase